MSAYSPAKATWHTDKIESLRQGVHIAPTHVQLIISDLCNQNCGFCAYRMDGGFSTEQFGGKNPNRMIPTEKCKEIIEDCALLGVKAIQFTGGGEPTVHPDCEEIITYAQDAGLETALVTNGTRLPSRECLERLSWVRISIDAGTEATYQSIRESKLWPKAIDGLRVLGSLNGPLVGVGFVVTRDNWQEIPQACDFARSAGAAYIRLAAIFSEQGASYYHGIKDSVENVIRTMKDCLYLTSPPPNFRIVDMFSHRLGDLNQASPEHEFCGYQQFTTYIGGDQKVYRCCTTSYTKHGEIGDLSNQSFAQWWANYSYAGFDARTCHHCQFHAQNKAINYLMTEPEHVNFV